MEGARKNFSAHVAIDCNWSSPVRAVHGIVTVVDNVNNTVIENTTLAKVGKNRPTGNFTGTSKNMEIEGSHSVIQKREDHQIFDQVMTISKDRDNKSNKLIKDIGSEDLIRFDPGHFRKYLKTQLQNFISNNKEFVYSDRNGNEVKVNNPFYGLVNHIIKWVNIFLKEQADDRRIAMLLSMVPHFIGQYDN